MSLHLIYFKHVESLPSNIWSMVNLEWTGVLLFYYFVYLKVNLDLEKTNQLGESSPNFIFVPVNLDPMVTERKWTDGESWPNDFCGKVNRGEDLRWVGSRCPLMHALISLLPCAHVHNETKYTRQWKNQETFYELVICLPTELVIRFDREIFNVIFQGSLAVFHLPNCIVKQSNMYSDCL